MKAKRSNFWISLSSLCLLSCSLTANEMPSSEATYQEHVVVSSTPMSAEKKEEMYHARAAEVEKAQSLEKESASKKCASYALNLSQGTLYFNQYTPLSQHFLQQIKRLESAYAIEMEDGSHWTIPETEVAKTLEWRPGSRLSITPHRGGWFYNSPYSYYIINEDAGSYVSSNLHIGPIAQGPKTHWIMAIDYAKGNIFLENGTSWSVAEEDLYLFDEWVNNQTIIIGNNDRWFASHSSILINVDINNFVRAKRF